MQRKIVRLSLALALTLAVHSSAKADNGSYQYLGGSFGAGTSTGQNISVQGAPLAGTNATLSFACPITSYGAGTYQLTWTCSGGSITIASTDNSLVFQGSILSGSMSFSGSGGGRGGHVSYAYQFSGTFSGVVTSAGKTQIAYGSVSQYVKTSGQIGSGTAPVTSGSFGWNSAYSPLLVGDAVNGRILRTDNVAGTNLASYGSPGTGVGNFGTVAGLAVDSTSHIYIVDSTLDRLVRIDDLTGKNWTELGGAGNGTNQFSSPRAVTIDASGKIWIADSDNNRIVRIDDLTGKGWTTFGSLGSGINQFSAPNGIAFDASGRIYVLDSGNSRLVRIDDMTGTNWATLTQLNIDPYGYPLTSLTGIVINPSGRISVADGTWLLGMDDITGTNGSVIAFGGALAGLNHDSSGTFYLISDTAPQVAQLVNGTTAAGYYGASLGQVGLMPSAIVARPVRPLPADPLLSATALAFGSRNVGEPGALHQVVLTNLGSGPLVISSVTAGADFKLTDTCSSPLPGGQSCSLGVQFDPTTTGPRTSKLTVTTTGVHTTLTTKLSGIGLVPGAVVAPAALSFDSQLTGTASSAQLVTLTNPDSGPLTIVSIKTTGDFTQTSNCPSVLAAGNGCTLQVIFKPSAAGIRSGSLVISDDAIPAGTQQTITLQGMGSATAIAFTLSPESLLFPNQLVSTTSSSQTVTLTNHSGSTSALTAATYSPGFKGTTTCGSTLANSGSCTFKVQFAPTSVGSGSGTLTIPITGKPSLTAALSGTAVASGSSTSLAINPLSIDFGQVVLGDGASSTMTVMNATRLPAGIRSISLSSPKQLKISSNNCPTVLPGGGSCVVKVSFSPSTAAAYYNGTLSVTESSGFVTQIPVTGEGVIDNGN